MPGSKPVIGLSWEPKLPTLANGTENGLDKRQNLQEGSSGYKPYTELIDGLFVPPNDPKKLNKLLRKQVKDTAGKSWFDMPAPTMTPELKKDLQLLKLRGVMDPKRHYKKGDSKSKTLPKYFQASILLCCPSVDYSWIMMLLFMPCATIIQVGTVIEGTSEFFTGRLTKKERKATLAEELLSDPSLGNYRKRKVREIEEHNRPAGVDKWKNRGRQSWKRAKQRRH
ncbi:hypothetical protein RJ640_025833 [Escallonia rubra]|uniref:Fcf2 pre-rRNA processing C-terminal domain-containing protein n=1 Tax=Escallonia rubra TaxID=112253 RepID=A0AA88QYE6_9ASTE|nr:hypothetical protein RJ640_025833 [Escallonia rubra]